MVDLYEILLEHAVACCYRPLVPVCLSRIILGFCLRSLPGKCTLTQGEPVKVVNWGQSLISVLIDPETFRKRSASLEHSPQSVGNPR